ENGKGVCLREKGGVEVGGGRGEEGKGDGEVFRVGGGEVGGEGMRRGEVKKLLEEKYCEMGVGGFE
ncbi:hypothetical protein, partial [Paenibacillus sp. Y412MC10]|uniref:hypothetical protein n=1 Tax=Geobacillus sp. (strain Y412MC10) TaxID=481743 RepID=UPI001C92BFB6